VKGRDNRSYDDIAGSYPVIGPYAAAGFIVETPGGPRSLCRTGTCDWYAEHTALVKGQPEITNTTRFKAGSIDADSLYESLLRLQSAGRVYVSGTLRAGHIASMPPTVEVTGENVTLNYAAASLPGDWGGQRLTDIDLAIQVRHDPGISVPEIRRPEQAEGGELPPLLKKWIDATEDVGN